LQYIDYQLIEAATREKAKEDYKDEINEAGIEQGKEKDTGEEATINQELVEAKIESTENIFERVLMESEIYSKVKDLPNYMDLFNGSD